MRDEFARAATMAQVAHLAQDCDECAYRDIAAPMCLGYFITDYLEKHYPELMAFAAEELKNKTTEGECASDGT